MFANAEAYERFMGRWSRLLAPLFIDFTNIRDVRTVLDIGSGTGSLSFELVQRRAAEAVTGIDSAREYVAYATSRNPVPDRIHFEVAEAQHLRFEDATFESSLSLLVFNFIPDPLQALQEVRRVTAPGGLIAAAIWDYGGEMRMLRTFWDAAGSIDDKARLLDESRMPLCRSGELADLWKHAGLKNVQQQSLQIEMRFDSFEDYWHPFLLGQGPAGAYATGLHSGASEQLQSELKRRLLPSGKDGSFVLPARAWAVRGTVPATAAG
jgi:ubiquinone/menaquinone biosynthesis C-methylase UbiE